MPHDAKSTNPVSGSSQFLTQAPLGGEATLRRGTRTRYHNREDSDDALAAYSGRAAKLAQSNSFDKGCHCKRSKCLKLYCECFAKGKAPPPPRERHLISSLVIFCNHMPFFNDRLLGVPPREHAAMLIGLY